MKRFFLCFLVFAVLMGGLPVTCIADDDDAVVSFDIKDDNYDLVPEEIEEPVDEITLK